MPRPHPFATAPASKGRARAVAKPAFTVYDYARVSTGGQSVDAQARQLRAAGAAKVFREGASGAKTDRRQPARLVSELAASRPSRKVARALTNSPPPVITTARDTWRRISSTVVQLANNTPPRTAALIGPDSKTVARALPGLFLITDFIDRAAATADPNGRLGAQTANLRVKAHQWGLV